MQENKAQTETVNDLVKVLSTSLTPEEQTAFYMKALDIVLSTFQNKIDDTMQKNQKTLSDKIDNLSTTINAKLEVHGKSLDYLDDFSHRVVGDIAAIKGEVKNSSDSIRKAVFAASDRQAATISEEIKKDRLFYSTINSDEENAWVERIKNGIVSMCLDYKLKPEDVYDDLYDSVLKKDRYDVVSIFNKHKNYGTDIISMCSKSDVLRFAISKSLNSIWYQEKNKYNKLVKQFNYKVVTGCPKEVTEIVAKMFKTVKPTGKQYSKAYGLLGMNLDELVLKTKKEYGIKHCSVPFAIWINKEVFKLFAVAANNYLDA